MVTRKLPLIVAIALTACGAVQSPTTNQAPITPGVPLTTWEAPSMLETERNCAPRWFQPATLCTGQSELEYDGCTWHCVPRPLGRVRVITTPGDGPKWKAWP